MLALGKSLSAKPSVRAPGVAPPWPVVRLQRTSFRVIGGDPNECLVEEIPAEWFGGWRNALHVHCFSLHVHRFYLMTREQSAHVA